MRSRKKLPFSH